jgi:indolepyruvate decarboxylase
VARTGLQSQLLALVNASRLPFATMFMAKSVLDEQHPSYIGMYDGKLMNHGVGAFVEGCDCVLAIGQSSPISTLAPSRRTLTRTN